MAKKKKNNAKSRIVRKYDVEWRRKIKCCVERARKEWVDSENKGEAEENLNRKNTEWK